MNNSMAADLNNTTFNTKQYKKWEEDNAKKAQKLQEKQEQEALEKQRQAEYKAATDAKAQANTECVQLFNQLKAATNPQDQAKIREQLSAAQQKLNEAQTAVANIKF